VVVEGSSQRSPRPLWALNHEVGSANEAPIAPSFVSAEAAKAGLVGAETRYWWFRMNTDALGPLSPGYRFSARKPGAPEPSKFRLRRSLEELSLPGLRLDSGCAFSIVARQQAEEIRSLWSIARQVTGFRA
jgi:hypothetical protein